MRMARDVEKCISLAEIAFKSGNTKKAIIHAKAALLSDITPQRRVALRIFIAKAHSKLGEYEKSNTIYRALISENNYLPPIVMGLLYNNFKSKEINNEKLSRNIRLVKLYTGGAND
ncbi:MAG: hypothetical protein FWC00_04695 [Firmicutes bacterium]|nr:hypothetical protein [Bacillota bacterium]